MTTEKKSYTSIIKDTVKGAKENKVLLCILQKGEDELKKKNPILYDLFIDMITVPVSFGNEEHEKLMNRFEAMSPTDQDVIKGLMYLYNSMTKDS